MLARLAASYAFGIAVIMHLLMAISEQLSSLPWLPALQGHKPSPQHKDRYLAFLSLAAGEMTEAQMTEWLERYIVPLPPAPITQ